MATQKKLLTFEEELAIGQAKLRKEILQWKFVPQLMLVPIIITGVIFLLGYSFDESVYYALLVTPVVWVVWSAIKRAPASMVPAAVILALGAVIGSFIVNGIDITNQDNLGLLAMSGVFIPVVAFVSALILMLFSLLIMSSAAFKKVFNYIPYDADKSEKPHLSAKFADLTKDKLIKHSVVWFGGSIADADKGTLSAYKDRLEFENSNSKDKKSFAFKDARGAVVERRELILNLKNGERLYFAFFDRSKLTWGAIISIGTMVILTAFGVPFWAAMIIPLTWIGGAIKGFDHRIKELNEWRKVLHNFIDIEQMSGYPMRVSFAKFMTLAVLFMTAAFLVSVFVSYIAGPF